MAEARNLARFAAGCVAAGVVGLLAGGLDRADAAPRGRRGGALQVQRINVDGAASIPANEIVEIQFTGAVDPASVSPATLQMRAQNPVNQGFTRQVFGSFQVVGNIVRFYPRLPTHLRDANGEFFTAGSSEDDASANAGFQPSTNYQLTIVGRPSYFPVRGANGRPLKATRRATFSTASALDASLLYTTRTYGDSDSPQYSFSNPADTVPTAADKYATHGGTRDVVNNIAPAIYCTKVPLSPNTVRVLGNIELTQIARNGNYALRRPVPGSVFLEQNFATTLLVYQPLVGLADLGTYTLRISKGVKDLTEEQDFKANRDRERLRQIYDSLALARSYTPGEPWESLADPDDVYTYDWPASDVERGELKRNILTLGDTYPDELDPRVMLMFTTRDEPVTDGLYRTNFTGAENIYDAQLSTAELDGSVQGAASAVFTASGGSAVNGDFFPTANQTLNTDNYPLNTINFRRLSIPSNATITITGTRPATIRSLGFLLEGAIHADGRPGTNTATSNSYYYTAWSQNAGGLGGPGGGAGGKSARTTNTPPTPEVPGKGFPGEVGADANGTPASAQDGGQPGQGGTMGPTPITSTIYVFGGGGGGGAGMRTDGKTGQSSSGTPYASWNGQGGAGGKAALGNDDLDPLVGGAGGGAGGSGSRMDQSGWGKTGGGGGGGGGAILVQTSAILTMGTNAAIRARGGRGGNGSNNYATISGGGAGGGGGGSILLRTSRAFNIANPGVAFDVAGGVGGTNSGSYTSSGGAGGSGLVRTEDPNGGLAIPGGTQGIYNPVGGGLPSFVYTRWVDLSVQDPRILPYRSGDVATTTENDAVLVEMQMTREHPSIFGTPDTSAIDGVTQNSTNTAVASQWVPIKIHDKTGKPGGALPVPGWSPGTHGQEYAGFPVTALNGKGYRWMRFRITFQLDDTQMANSPVPFVDFVETRFQFNF